MIIGGCETRTVPKGEIIKINPYEAKEFVNLSEIADSIKLIRLKTEGDDVIGRAIIIVIKKKYIYVQDSLQDIVFVFNKEGKYVSKLNKRGQGPGEYAVMGPLFVDDNEEYIELMDFRRKMVLKYSNISFEFIESTPFPNLNFETCKKHDNYYYCATKQYDNFINDIKTIAGLIIVDDKNNLKTFFNRDVETDNQYYAIHIESFTINNKNELFMSLMFDNTFYKLKEGEVYPIISVDFGKYGMNNSMVGSLSTQKQVQYIKDMRDLAAFPSLDINNSDIMSFAYFFKQEESKVFFWKDDYRLYLKFKESNKVFHVKHIKNDLSSFPDRIYLNATFFGGCAHEVWHEDYLIDIVVPSFYFEEPTDKAFVDGIGEITMDDDPIIVMMKLKKSQ